MKLVSPWPVEREPPSPAVAPLGWLGSPLHFSFHAHELMISIHLVNLGDALTLALEHFSNHSTILLYLAWAMILPQT